MIVVESASELLGRLVPWIYMKLKVLRVCYSIGSVRMRWPTHSRSWALARCRRLRAP